MEKFEILTVDKATAEHWLGACNVNNRHLRRALVARYARDMENGDWKETADPIRFGSNGQLLDGQHRLAAIAKSNVKLEMLIVTDLDPAAQQYMDMGAKRTPGDALSLAGYVNPNILGAVARATLTYQLGRSNVSTPELLNLVDAMPELVDAAEVASRVKRHLRSGTSTGALGLAFLTLAKTDLGDAYRFFEALQTGANLPPGSPILTLRNKLLTNPPPISSSPAYLTLILSMFVRTWNSWRTGKRLSSIRLTTTIPKVR